jgi:hypothetical protein
VLLGAPFLLLCSQSPLLCTDKVCRTVFFLFRLQNRAERLQSALDAQTEVNKQLMSRKSDIEWQLMTALASVCPRMIPERPLIPSAA